MLCELICALASTLAANDGVDAARAWRTDHGPAIIREFAELLSIPNVASDREGITRNATAIIDAFSERGVSLEGLTLRGAPPIVVGRLTTPGATRTLGIYIHYDGQPVDQARWDSLPWTPTLRTGSLEDGGLARGLPRDGQEIDPEWRLYARSSGDDKAPLIALLAAIDALQASDIAITSNLVFLFEGEEEAGSRHLPEYLATYGDRLAADAWLIFDGPVHQSRTPQIVFGVRGITSIEITTYGADRDLHSGHYGNWSPNPALQLVELLAGMKDASGRVTIDGFYDDVVPLSDAEQAALERVPSVDEELLESFGIGAPEMQGVSLTESLLLPSLNIKGIASGNVGPASRNAIPQTATANLDIRLVKGNDPRRMQELVEAYIESQGFHIVREDPDRATRLAHPRIAKVTRAGGYRAARTSMDLPIVAPLVEATEAAAGEEVILMPTLGGSLPLYVFEDMLEAPVIIMPIANHDNNQHGPNENIRIANLWYGIDLFASVLTMD